MRPHMRFITVFSIILGFVLLDIFYSNTILGGNGNTSRKLLLGTKNWIFGRDPVDEHSQESKYILETDLCKIPRTAIMPAYFKEQWQLDQIPDCSFEKLLGVVTRSDNVLELLPEYLHSNCCIQEIGRLSGKDNTYTLSPCQTIEFDIPVQDKEMYVVRCKDSFNFEVNLPIHPRVRVHDKINYWKKKISDNPASRPINVLLLGIDTVSRSHAFRSFPKTMAYLKGMGFHDFLGYHSVAPSTLTNFMAFLMGLRRSRVRETCASNWSSPFDTCPLIWKNYSTQNYVTMYVEDGSQTFNWGGQSGFNETPTDYYIHSLFKSIEGLRLENFKYEKTSEMKNLHLPCTSNETVPQFLTRYTKRFVQKFRHTPFFSFTWYSNPFHEYFMSGGTLEQELLPLFEYFNSLPSFLENTLIVFVSDHGIRHGEAFFDKGGIEAYIERGLPPFFIRVPKRLQQMYPRMNLNKVMADNAHELTSPFDLHHTLLHVLELSGLGHSTHAPFKPLLPDRASLFVPIKGANTTRNCKTLNIFSDSCVCNTLTDMESIHNPYYLGQMTAALQAKLRDIVEQSKYSEVCEEWSVQTGDVISAQVIGKEDGSTINLIRFAANPGNASFEAKVRVITKNSQFDKCEVVGSLNRINLYGDQSTCVKEKTDKDKEMKALCMCKNKPKD